jgi:hypothetical protein
MEGRESVSNLRHGGRVLEFGVNTAFSGMYDTDGFTILQEDGLPRVLRGSYKCASVGRHR